MGKGKLAMNYKNSIAQTIVTDPTEWPLDLEGAKDQVSFTGTEKNAKLTSLIKEVTLEAEKMLGRKIITQTWKAFYAGWPDEYFIIPFGQLQSVTHIKYKDTDGDQTTWSSADYIVDTDQDPGRVTLGYAKSWPSTTLYPSNPIEIQFVCGYGLAADVPEDLKNILKVCLERKFSRPGPNYDKYMESAWDLYLMNNRCLGV